jgi:hypothetical protein
MRDRTTAISWHRKIYPTNLCMATILAKTEYTLTCLYNLKNPVILMGFVDLAEKILKNMQIFM